MASHILSLLVFLAILRHSHSDEHLHPKVTKMTVYYQDYSGEKNSTTIQIPNQPAGPLDFFKFGNIFAIDEPITQGIEEDSAQIARARGVSVTSALDGSDTHVLVSVVFTHGKYKGSTLEIQGSSPQLERVREVAVVGGTGKFRFARGYATFETLHYDPVRHYAAIQSNMTIVHYYSPAPSLAYV